MEHGQTEEGEVSQHLFLGASIEQIDNATMSQVWWWIFLYKVHSLVLQLVELLLILPV
jgi:hypothetical protein